MRRVGLDEGSGTARQEDGWLWQLGEAKEHGAGKSLSRGVQVNLWESLLSPSTGLQWERPDVPGQTAPVHGDGSA